MLSDISPATLYFMTTKMFRFNYCCCKLCFIFTMFVLWLSSCLDQVSRHPPPPNNFTVIYFILVFLVAILKICICIVKTMFVIMFNCSVYIHALHKTKIVAYFVSLLFLLLTA